MGLAPYPRAITKEERSMKTYAGVGSRRTPTEVLRLMERIGKRLASRLGVPVVNLKRAGALERIARLVRGEEPR